jgi:hypothetical protein
MVYHTDVKVTWVSHDILPDYKRLFDSTSPLYIKVISVTLQMVILRFTLQRKTLIVTKWYPESTTFFITK